MRQPRCRNQVRGRALRPRSRHDASGRSGGERAPPPRRARGRGARVASAPPRARYKRWARERASARASAAFGRGQRSLRVAASKLHGRQRVEHASDRSSKRAQRAAARSSARSRSRPSSAEYQATPFWICQASGAPFERRLVHAQRGARSGRPRPGSTPRRRERSGHVALVETPARSASPPRRAARPLLRPAATRSATSTSGGSGASAEQRVAGREVARLHAQRGESPGRLRRAGVLLERVAILALGFGEIATLFGDATERDRGRRVARIDREQTSVERDRAARRRRAARARARGCGSSRADRARARARRGCRARLRRAGPR